MKRLLLTAPLIIACAVTALAQCGPGDMPALAPAGTPWTGWHKSERYPSWWYYRENGFIKYGWEPATDDFRVYYPATNVWTYRMVPPWGANAELRAKADAATALAVKPVPNFGVDVDKLKVKPTEPPVKNFGVALEKLVPDEAGTARYILNGRPVPREIAMAALTGDLTDDTQKLRLTIIGAEPERKTVLRDLSTHPALMPYRLHLLVQDYPADHWAVKTGGFYADGKPTIYLQAPTGMVLHRQVDYLDGAEGLAVAIRKADPSYDPKKDPDTRKPGILSGLGIDLDTRTLVLLAAAAVGLFLFFRSPSSPPAPPQTQVNAPQPLRPAAESYAPPPAPLPPREARPARAEQFTFAEIIRAERAQQRREDEAAARRQQEREETKAAFAELVGAKPATSPEPPPTVR